MNKNTYWIIVAVIILVIGAYFIGQGSKNLAGIPDETGSGGNKLSVASYDDMVSSCKSIADDNLRNGFYEYGLYNNNLHTQPSNVSNNVFYNASKSTCYFSENLIEYPKTYSATDSYKKEGFYLFAAGMLPNGVVQHTANGDSQQGTVLPMAYCTIDTYQYPTAGSQTTHCVNFQLKQTGAGTNNYHATALGIGNTISRSEYEGLAQKYMSASN